MSSSKLAVGFLLQVYEEPPPEKRKSLGPRYHYHLFPGHSIPQEEFSFWVKKTAGLNLTLVPQLDGSRLKLISPSRWEGGNVRGLARLMEDSCPYEIQIVPCGEDLPFLFEELQKGVGVDRFIYKLFVFQEYENGNLIVPMIWDKGTDTCWNIQSYWEAYKSDVDIGVVVDYKLGVDPESRLQFLFRLPGVPPAEVIDYRPQLRLCPCCLHPRDVSVKPPKRIWINTRWKKLQSDNFPKSRH